MKAIRLPDTVGRTLPRRLDDSQICYWKQDEAWWIYLPGAGAGELRDHTVTEHDDGTITVSPSIGFYDQSGTRFKRHGFLRRGIWEPCSDDRAP